MHYPTVPVRVVVMTALIASPFYLPVEAADDKALWSGEIDISKKENIPIIPSDYRIIDQCEKGDYQFTIAPDLVYHKGEFVAQWANSWVDENDENSLVRGRRSPDAKVWSEREVIAPGFEGKGYHSHGVFHVVGNQLRSYVAQINHLPRPEGALRGGYSGLRTDVFLYDDSSKTWTREGMFGELDGFWPLCQPIRLENGNWAMAGAVYGEKSMVAGIAICDGKDFTQWRIVRLPYEDGLEKAPASEVWGETTLAAHGPNLLAVTRNQKGAWSPFLYAKSNDYGETWSPLKPSNFPGGGGRPQLGTLPDGRHFLVANMGSRNTLILALTEPDSFQFNRIFRVLDHAAPPPTMPGKAKRPQWGYPGVLVHDGKIFIAYSVSKEATGISVIDLARTN